MTDVRNILEHLVSIPSPYPFEEPLVRWVTNYLTELGFSVELVPTEGRHNIVATKGSGSSPLLLFGHLDTVPIQGVEEHNPHSSDGHRTVGAQAESLGWHSHPFVPTIVGDRLVGSGAYDMKAGVAAILAVIGCLPDSWYQQNQLKVALTVGEEHLSQGMYALVQSGLLKDVVACVSTEILDTADRVEGEEPGVETILLGRRGRVAIEAKVYGKASHAASPSQGVNAVEEACRIVSHVMQSAMEGPLPLRTHPVLPQATLTPLSILAGTSSLSIPNLCTVVFDRHLVPPESPERVVEELRQCLLSIQPPVRFEIQLQHRPVPYLMPFVTSPDSELVRLAAKAVEEVAGASHFSGGNSVADENLLASTNYDPPLRHATPTIIMGCRGGNFHQENEWVDLGSLGSLVRALTRFCMIWGEEHS